MPLDVMLLRLATAALLGSIIGYERDIHGRAAGLRTHMLVSIGATLFTLVSMEFAMGVDGLTTRGDPGRIAAQIVTGIGFLGAGTILKNGVSIKGLTTAACLWLVAAIGMACGSGNLTLAIIVTLSAVILLIGAKQLELNIPRTCQLKLMVVTATFDEMTVIRDHLAAQKNIIIKELNFSFHKENQKLSRSGQLKTLFILESFTRKSQTAFAADIFGSLRKIDPLPIHISLVNNH
ncbi:MAG: MgtC/SapB family protein [Lentisphaerae bacterium]|nr:MgtC/SapB family protein [Lentisphaerota bacterium]